MAGRKATKIPTADGQGLENRRTERRAADRRREDRRGGDRRGSERRRGDRRAGYRRSTERRRADRRNKGRRGGLLRSRTGPRSWLSPEENADLRKMIDALKRTNSPED